MLASCCLFHITAPLQALARNQFTSVLRTLPGWDTATMDVLRGAQHSAKAWLLQLYGWDKEEELGSIPADGMPGA